MSYPGSYKGGSGVVVVQGESPGGLGSRVHLYSHWKGYELHRAIRRALAKQTQWGNPDYLARMIFCEMLEHDRQGTTGYGISSSRGAGRVIVVDCDLQTVKEGNVVHTFEEYGGAARA